MRAAEVSLSWACDLISFLRYNAFDDVSGPPASAARQALPGVPDPDGEQYHVRRHRAVDGDGGPDERSDRHTRPHRRVRLPNGPGLANHPDRARPRVLRPRNKRTPAEAKAGLSHLGR